MYFVYACHNEVMTCVDIGAGFNIDFVDELYCERVKLEIDEMQMLE